MISAQVKIFMFLLALSLVGTGCISKDNRQASVGTSEPEQAVDRKTAEAEPRGESTKIFQGLSLAELGADDERYGQKVRWEGAFCGLSQINGIKLCFLDDAGGTDNMDMHNWFWGVSEVVPSAEEHRGKWASWMLKKYGNIDADTLTGDEVFVVTGTFVFSDCTFYDDADICIPNISVTDIAVK